MGFVFNGICNRGKLRIGNLKIFSAGDTNTGRIFDFKWHFILNMQTIVNLILNTSYEGRSVFLSLRF